MAGLMPPPGAAPGGLTSPAPRSTSGGLMPPPTTGGLMPPPGPPEEAFNPTPWGFVQNIASGLGNMVIGLGTLFIGAPAHDLAQGVAHLIPGEQPVENEPSQLATIARTMLPGAWVPGEDLGGKWGGIVGDFGERYGGASNIVKGFYEDPLAYVMDALMVAGGVGAAAKVGRVGALSKLPAVMPDAAAARILGPSLTINEGVVGVGRYTSTGRYGVRPFASLASGPNVETLKVASNPLMRGVQNLVYNKIGSLAPEDAAKLAIAGADSPAGLPAVAFGRAQAAIDLANAQGLRVLRPGLGNFIASHSTSRLLSGRRVITSSKMKDAAEDVNLAAYGSLKPGKVRDPITGEMRDLDMEAASEYARGTATPTELPNTDPINLGTTWNVLDEAPSPDQLVADGAVLFDEANTINDRIAGKFGSRKEGTRRPNQTPLSPPESPYAPAGAPPSAGGQGAARYQMPVESLDQADAVAKETMAALGWTPEGRLSTLGDASNPWDGLHYYGRRQDGTLGEISIGTPDMLFQQAQATHHIANLKRLQNEVGEIMIAMSRTSDEVELSRMASRLRMLQDEITAGFEYTRMMFNDTRAQWWADHGVGTYIPEMKAAYRLRAVADKWYTRDWMKKVGVDNPYTVMMERAYQPLRSVRMYESMTRIREGLEEIFRRQPVKTVAAKVTKEGEHVLTTATKPGQLHMPGDQITRGMELPVFGNGGQTYYVKVLKAEKGSSEIVAEFRDDAGNLLETRRVTRPEIVGAHEKYLEANPATPITKRIPKSVHEFNQLGDVIRLMEAELPNMPENVRNGLLDEILGDRPFWNSANKPSEAALRLTRRWRRRLWDHTVVEGGHGRDFGLPEYDWRTMHDARIIEGLPTAQYVPDMPRGNPSGYFRKGGIGRVSLNSTPTAYSKRSLGLLYSTGRQEPDLLKVIQRKAMITIEHNEMANMADKLIRSYGRVITEREAMLIDEFGVDTGEAYIGPEMAKRMFSLRGKLLESQLDNYMLLDDIPTGKSRLQAATEAAIDDWAGDVMEEVFNGLGKSQVWAVPKSVAKTLEHEIATRFGHGVRIFWDTPMSLWKASVLSLSPRWIINNFFGNTLFVGIENPAALQHAIRGLDGKQRRIAAYVLGEDNLALDEMGFYNPVTDYGGQTAAEFTKGNKVRGAIAGNVDVAGRAATLPTRMTLGLSGFIKHMNGHVEQAFRRGILIDEISKRTLNGWVGMFHKSDTTLRKIASEGIDEATMAAALKGVDRTLGNFMQYSPIEQNIIRRFFMPFYGFYRHMVNVLVKFPIEHPLKGSVARLIGEMNASMLENMPEYMQDQMPIHIGTLGGQDVLLRLKNMNPLSMVNEDIPFIGTLNPALKMMIERSLGVNTFTGEPFDMPTDGSMVQTSEGRYWSVKRDSAGNVIGVESTRKPLPSLVTHFGSQFGPLSLIPQFQLYPKSFLLNLAGFAGVPMTMPKTSLEASVKFDQEMEQQALAAAKPSFEIPNLFES